MKSGWFALVVERKRMEAHNSIARSLRLLVSDRT